MTPWPFHPIARRAALRLGLAGLGVAGLGLSGCTNVLGSGAVLDAYDLRPPVDLPQARARGALELVLEAPSVPGALDTDRILIRPNPLQAQYLPGARWAETTPDLLRTLWVQAFEASGALRQAGRRPLASFGDYRLNIEVLAFELDASGAGEAVAVMRIAARLIDDRGGASPTSRTFSARVQVSEDGTLGRVRALNTAAGSVTSDLVGWVLERMGIAARRPQPPTPPQTPA